MLLTGIGLTCLIGGSILFPNLPIVVGSIIKIIEETKGYSLPRNKVRRTLKRLEGRKLLYIENRGEKATVHLTDKGKQIIIKYSLTSLLELKRKKKSWNHKWFMVFFDVPESERAKRDHLRTFLTEIGFIPYQKSVYIFPYECEREILLVKKIIEGGKYLSYVIADRIEYEDEMKKTFKL
ncbi:CRISPR-associated endonuclease Cas2 [Candidatus Roizmanbacteria bacterium CG_4_10_14_0_8_um_filter_39_9]|uniref:CRISPR-associated endonuclease Cas2 n=1 Tax=Candidatus Roizmanbacteria bacterium CG_4_10_14_0_8_um_filter_39_9 TaxID=1974829 RepID=A0A2M7QD77_9BACT|nr:MAG: CRISPR-associated endonuclease Cas2 [Candidatus Roizmanbacteria bacterium CG_4_10_14_0_8_um_filter_39_9]